MPVTSDEWRTCVRMFFAKVELKTSWGKNELRELWDQCFQQVLADGVE